MGFQANIPIGFRAALAGVRNAQLQLARERAVLQEEELEMMHGLILGHSHARSARIN